MSKHRSHSRAHTHFAGHVCPKQLSTVFTRVRFVVAQTVDPRDFEINGLVKRFKRIYKFVEQSLDAVPLVASPMRQILAEAFNVSNDYLREVEEQYAALAMLPSASFDEPQPTTIKHLETDVEMKVLTATGVSIVENEVEEAEVEPPLVFEKDDMVEILHSELWYAGVVLERNEDFNSVDTYSMMWHVKDKSQRFRQRTLRHLLREPQEVPTCIVRVCS
ncbi:unnamed protein product [Peronospora destructor]|uniref:Uncharacterized protein n=1 Tax=Peronospora destructor TaxID=86335 RepID=A0AAV0TZG1_9STRA|nr:unnamed protein product [Peronospora destructor]